MKKILSESLDEYRLNEEEPEVFKGQVKTGLDAEDFDPGEFLLGLAVEKMHSTSLAVQKTLAVQKLSKNPKHYSEAMKKGLIDDVEAMNLYKKYFVDKKEQKTMQQNA